MDIFWKISRKIYWKPLKCIAINLGRSYLVIVDIRFKGNNWKWKRKYEASFSRILEDH